MSQLQKLGYCILGALTHCAGCPQAGWLARRLRAERRAGPAASADTCCPSAPSHFPHDKGTRQPTQHWPLLHGTTHGTKLSWQWDTGRTFVHESSSVVSVRLGTGAGVERAGRRRGQACRAPSSAERAPAPRAPPAPCPAPALTLRANHTPNNAAAYYLLLRFICSYIGLMVSDRCERLQPLYDNIRPSSTGSTEWPARGGLVCWRRQASWWRGCRRAVAGSRLGSAGGARLCRPRHRPSRTCVGKSPGNPLLIPALPLSKECRRRCYRQNFTLPLLQFELSRSKYASRIAFVTPIAYRRFGIFFWRRCTWTNKI